MDVNNTETTNTDPSTDTRSVFFCQQLPHFTWDLRNTTIPWILVVIIAIASPVTILLNSFIIVAVKRRKELQKPVNTMLSSLAVADLLVGAILMPLTATVDILILRQVSFQHICILESAANKPMLIFFSFSSLYHLTVVAWERYMAIQKSINYKVIVTKGLLQKLAIAAWLLGLFTAVPIFLMAVVPVDPKLVQIRHVSASFLTLACLIAIAYFYSMVYLGVRKRKIDAISQVTALMKAKLESKVAKTTGLLSATLIFSFFPVVAVGTLGKIFSGFGTNLSFRLAEALANINSLVSPFLYCYRDRQFRKAVLELLGIRKPEAIQPAVVPARFVKRNDPYGAAELRNLPQPSMKGSAPSDQNVSSVCVQKSAPKLNKRSCSFDSFQLQQPSSILTATATIHMESSVPRNARKTSQWELDPRRITPHSKLMSRSKSWDAS